MNDLSIKIENVKKQYRLGAIGGGTLQGDLQSWWAKVRGKEDPNTKIGAKVYKKNEKFLALDGINLEIKKGEAVGIIGHNGAGKSTLLKLLSRVTAPTEGNIYINGRISSMLEVGTGFHPELTGRENIYLNGAILGMSREEVTSKIDQIIEFSECGQFIDTPVKRYSSGMYVKLAFSVSAHLDSEILIMDEVLAVGDMKFQQKCIDKMSKVSEEEGRTILYVSHNMNTIKKLCDRCIVLEHGKVIFNGAVDEAISIYMGNQLSDDSYFDYSHSIRNHKSSQALELLSSHFPNKTSSVFVPGEKAELHIRCKANRDIEKVGLRLEVASGDGTVIGTLFSDKDIAGSKGQIFKIVGTFDTAHICPGNYQIAMLTYEYNSKGEEELVDRVFPAITMKIEQEPDTLIWLSNHWGCVQFNDLKIEKVLVESEN